MTGSSRPSRITLSASFGDVGVAKQVLSALRGELMQARGSGSRPGSGWFGRGRLGVGITCQGLKRFERIQLAGIGFEIGFDQGAILSDDGPEPIPVEPFLGNRSHVFQVLRTQRGNRKQFAPQRLASIIQANQGIQVEPSPSPGSSSTTGAT